MHRIMDIARRSAAVMAGVWLVAGCAADHRDSGGNPMTVSEATEVAPSESRFNIYALLDDPPTPTITRRMRDNGITHMETMTGGGLNIAVEHVTKSWFSRTMRNRYDDPSAIAARFERDDIANIKKVQGKRRSTRGAVFDIEGCTVTTFLKRLKGQTLYDNDHYQADTYVRILDCRSDGNRLTQDSANALAEGFDLMSESDRAVIRARFSQVEGSQNVGEHGVALPPYTPIEPAENLLSPLEPMKSRFKPIDPAASRFNIFALLDNVTSVSFDRSVRDFGSIYVERKGFGNPSFLIQHHTNAQFSDAAFANYTSPEYVRETRGLSDSWEVEIVDGKHGTTRGVLFSAKHCHDLVFMKRLKPRTTDDNDRNGADTLVSLKFCRAGFDAKDFMNQFSVMSESDRAKLRARSAQSD